MRIDRFFLHPLLNNKKSLAILFFYLIFAIGLCAFLSMNFAAMLKGAGIPLARLNPPLNVIQKIFLSPYFQICLVPCAAVIGTAATSSYIKGPIKRIEGWLVRVRDGQPVSELKIRPTDKFVYLVRLLNELQARLEADPNKK